MAMKTYDPKKHSVIINGTPLQGLVKVDVNPEGSAYKTFVDAQGQKIRVKENESDVTITISTSLMASANAILSGYRALDITKDVGTFVITINEKNNLNTKYVGRDAWVNQMAKFSIGNDSEGYEWTIISPITEAFSIE
jgi:hypothetical protein